MAAAAGSMFGGGMMPGGRGNWNQMTPPGDMQLPEGVEVPECMEIQQCIGCKIRY